MLKRKDIVVNRHCLYLPFLHFILYVSIKSLYYFQSIDLTEEPKRHTEKWRAQRFYIAEIVRQRGIVGAWRNRGYLRVLLMFCLLHYKAVVCKIYGSSGIWSDKDLSKLSSLTKGHTEKRRGQRIIKKSNGSHGGTVGA